LVGGGAGAPICDDRRRRQQNGGGGAQLYFGETASRALPGALRSKGRHNDEALKQNGYNALHFHCTSTTNCKIGLASR